MSKKIRAALIKPPVIGHMHRGTGAYVDNLFRELQTSKIIDCSFMKYNAVSEKVDIVHFPYFDPFFLTLPIFKKKPTVITIHDLIPIRFPSKFPKGLRGLIKWNIQKKRAQQADVIVTDSHASKQDIVQFLGFDDRDVFPIYLAASDAFKQVADQMFLKKVKNKYKIPQKFVLYVGDVNWNKNLPGLITALKETALPTVLISSTLKDNVENFSHPSNKSLQEAKELLGTRTDQFTILGNVPKEELVALYNLATVFVFPSFYEGFGLPVVEAFACGCPVVCSNEGSLSEIAGDAAMFINPYDSNEIAEVVGKVFADEKLQKQLSKKGSEQVKRFSWKKTAMQTEKVYQQILESQ